MVACLAPDSRNASAATAWGQTTRTKRLLVRQSGRTALPPADNEAVERSRVDATRVIHQTCTPCGSDVAQTYPIWGPWHPQGDRFARCANPPRNGVIRNARVPDAAASVRDYLTSERRRNSSPTARGKTIQIIVVEASIAHSSPVFVAPSKSSTCV